MATTEPTRSRATLPTIALGAISIVAVLVTVLSTAGDLPNPAPAHFGIDGRPDRFASPTTVLWTSIAIPIVVIGLLVGIFVGAGVWRARLAKLMAAITAAMSGFVAVAVIGAHLAATSTPPHFSLAAFGVAIGVAAAFGAIGYLTTPAGTEPQTTLVTATAFAPSQRVAWSGRTRPLIGLYVAACSAPLAMVLAGYFADQLWIALIAVPITILVIATTQFRVQIDNSGIHFRGALGFPAGQVALADITAVEVANIRFGDFGGVGYRVGPGRIGLITGSGPALVVRHGDATLAVTLEDSVEAASVLLGLTQRASSR